MNVINIVPPHLNNKFVFQQMQQNFRNGQLKRILKHEKQPVQNNYSKNIKELSRYLAKKQYTGKYNYKDVLNYLKIPIIQKPTLQNSVNVDTKEELEAEIKVPLEFKSVNDNELWIREPTDKEAYIKKRDEAKQILKGYAQQGVDLKSIKNIHYLTFF